MAKECVCLFLMNCHILYSGYFTWKKNPCSWFLFNNHNIWKDRAQQLMILMGQEHSSPLMPCLVPFIYLPAWQGSWFTNLSGQNWNTMSFLYIHVYNFSAQAENTGCLWGRVFSYGTVRGSHCYYEPFWGLFSLNHVTLSLNHLTVLPTQKWIKCEKKNTKISSQIPPLVLLFPYQLFCLFREENLLEFPLPEYLVLHRENSLALGSNFP